MLERLCAGARWRHRRNHPARGSGAARLCHIKRRRYRQKTRETTDVCNGTTPDRSSAVLISSSQVACRVVDGVRTPRKLDRRPHLPQSSLQSSLLIEILDNYWYRSGSEGIQRGRVP
jgi:hypothetical protein